MDALFHAQLWEGAYLCRDEAEWRKQLELFSGCGGEVLCTGLAGAPDGYAFVWPSDTQVWAQELVCAPKPSWVLSRRLWSALTGLPAMSPDWGFPIDSRLAVYCAMTEHGRRMVI